MKIVFSPKLIDNISNNSDELLRLSDLLDFSINCVHEPSSDYISNFGLIFSSGYNYNSNTILFNELRSNILPKYRKILSSKRIKTEKTYADFFDDYLKMQDSMFILFLADEEKISEGIVSTISTKLHINYIKLYNPYICNYSLISDVVLINSNKELFSNQLCQHTNKYFMPYAKLKDSERNNYDFKFGKIVADRNTFIYDKQLSKINKKHFGKRRDVYIKYYNNKPIYYISIDTEHGALEVFSHQAKSPKHLGEFDFSCNKIKDANPKTHKLYLK